MVKKGRKRETETDRERERERRRKGGERRVLGLFVIKPSSDPLQLDLHLVFFLTPTDVANKTNQRNVCV